jgi:hypothetical protein
VAQATLYRHINTLVKGGILSVVEERPIRGTIERVFALEGMAARLTQEDIANFSKDDHWRIYTAFIAHLLRDFARYLDSHAKPDLVADGVSFTQIPVYLSDEEFMEVARRSQEIFLPMLSNPPAPGRKRRIFSNIVFPADEELSE